MTALAQADALRLPLADDSVDLVVTSPPYFALRSYQDGDEHYDGQIGSESTPQEFLEALWAATVEMVRVVKPSGSIFVNLGDKYAGSSARNDNGWSASSTLVGSPTVRNRDVAQKAVSYSTTVRSKSLMGLPWRYAIGCIDDLGLILRSEIVWSKPNGLPESVTDRVRRSHEQWFHFTLEPHYFSAIDEIREAPNTDRAQRGRALELAEQLSPEQIAAARAVGVADVGRGAAVQNGVNADETQRLASQAKAVLGGYFREFLGEASSLGRLPGSVWSIPSEPLQVPDHLGVDHFAAFPQEWPRRLILGWCPQEVCSECGEGRAPVVDRTFDGTYNDAEAQRQRDRANMSGGTDRVTLGRTEFITRTITGYACACPDTTAPSTPGVVLDPFAGTGTVPMVARALGRTGIGIDLSADYLRLADWRVFDSGHAAKTMLRTNQERQGSLL